MAELVYFNDFAPTYVGKAMKDSAPRVCRNIPMEAGIYANVRENQAGKRILFEILVGLGFLSFAFFLRSNTNGKILKKLSIASPSRPNTQSHFPL